MENGRCVGIVDHQGLLAVVAGLGTTKAVAA